MLLFSMIFSKSQGTKYHRWREVQWVFDICERNCFKTGKKWRIVGCSAHIRVKYLRFKEVYLHVVTVSKTLVFLRESKDKW